jgi:hypothetical protein
MGIWVSQRGRKNSMGKKRDTTSEEVIENHLSTKGHQVRS